MGATNNSWYHALTPDLTVGAMDVAEAWVAALPANPSPENVRDAYAVAVAKRQVEPLVYKHVGARVCFPRGTSRGDNIGFPRMASKRSE